MKIKNWKKFQHYKRRNPPWIKFHRSLLDDPEWHALGGDASKMLAMCWLIASETDGNLPSIAMLAFRLRTTEKNVTEQISKLSHWLESDASKPLARRYQDATPETEKHSEAETKDGDDTKPKPLISEEANKLADEIAKACGHEVEFIPPSWFGAPYRVQAWLLQGWPKEIILSSVLEQVARKRDGAPSHIEYFEKGIAAAIARNSAPIPIATFTEGRRNGTDAKSGLAAIDRIFSRLESGPETSAITDENVVLSLPARSIPGA